MQNIVSFLDYPDAVCGTDDLPHHWRRSVLRVTCARPEGFEGGAWFTAAIRGAWGHRLRERAENDTTVAAALSVFFSTLTHTEPGRSVPVPFTIRCDEIEHVLIAELALQGVADFWRAPAFDAFVRAFEDGLASRPNRRGVRTTFEILDAQWTRGEKLKVPINTGSARLVFRTPLRLGPRHAIRVY